MRELAFRILNVFTVGGDRLSGNPLAVIEDGSCLTAAEMQALARQFNLSETTFILPPSAPGADARVRIFTPSFEMPFAGHPTLGTAHVVRETLGLRRALTLEMRAGLVEVDAEGAQLTLRVASPPETRVPSATRAELAAMVELDASSIAADPLWVDTGSEQLVIPLRDTESVARARPVAHLVGTHGYSEKRGASMAYLWARVDSTTVLARFFFTVNGAVLEDPATGSACANLGGYLASTGEPLPVCLTVRQGEAVGRPSRLVLRVDEERRIFVGGEVIDLGRGRLTL